MTLIDHDGRVRGGDRGGADQRLGEVHQVAVFAIGLVELHHGELGVVPRRQPLVAEVAVDLEHLLEAADHQPLQIQLRRDAQEQLHVERVVVGGEGLGRRAAGDGMHHRRFHFEEVALDHEGADRLDDLRAALEGLARVVVGDEVEVALAVFLFLVGEAVEFFRQRTQRLRQQADRFGLDGQLALVGLEQGAGDADEIAQVPVLEGVVRFGAGDIVRHVDLDAPAHVLQGGEAGLAHHPLQHHAAGKLNLDGLAFQRFLGLVAMGSGQLARIVVAFKVVGEGDARCADRGELGAALGDDLVFVEGGGGGFGVHCQDRKRVGCRGRGGSANIQSKRGKPSQARVCSGSS